MRRRKRKKCSSRRLFDSVQKNNNSKSICVTEEKAPLFEVEQISPTTNSIFGRITYRSASFANLVFVLCFDLETSKAES